METFEDKIARIIKTIAPDGNYSGTSHHDCIDCGAMVVPYGVTKHAAGCLWAPIQLPAPAVAEPEEKTEDLPA